MDQRGVTVVRCFPIAGRIYSLGEQSGGEENLRWTEAAMGFVIEGHLYSSSALTSSEEGKLL